MFVKWNKDRKKIFAELALNKQKEKKTNVREARRRRKRCATKGRNERYPKAESLLVSEFQLRRTRGCRVSKLSFYKQMKLKIQQAYGKNEAAKFKASNNWFQRFKKRHNIALRNRTNKKKDSADDARATIQMFHRELRKVLKPKKRGNDDSPDPKYARWLPSQRYNVDQAPLPFVVGQEKTYEVLGAKQVWVSRPSSRLEKRQTTLQLCIAASSEQTVKPAIVFWGER